MSNLSIGQQIGEGINQSLQVLCVIFLPLVLALSCMYLLITVVGMITENIKDKQKKLYRISYQKKQLNEILKEVGNIDTECLIHNLNKTGTDLYLVFALPHYYFDEDTQIVFHRILKDVFDTDVKDECLGRIFDYWVKDYVSDVFLPVLLDKKYG